MQTTDVQPPAEEAAAASQGSRHSVLHQMQLYSMSMREPCLC